MHRFALAALVAATSAALVTAVPASAAAQPFPSTTFLATHNSYSGDVDGAKGAIGYQLDHGVRFVEFDVHDNGYATAHDYGVGHGSPGDLVDHDGNPASNNLRDWLDVVGSWSAAHPTAAPIVLMLDLKDDLTDNPSFADGNLAALNAELQSAFGTRLLPASEYPADATTDSLRGKVLTLLSGDSGTRAAYRRDVGQHPAVALNGRGQVVEVHDSGAGALWYWTGSYGADGRVSWTRHGRYDSGRTPAIALDDSGRIVEVHQSQNAATLWYRTGRLGADGEITWAASHQYDNGVLPTVAFTGDGVREIHRSAANEQNWQWHGSLDGDTVTWTGNAETTDPRYDRSSATSGSRRVSVTTGADGPTPAETVRYSTDRVSGDRVRYPQVAFDEYQKGDPAELQQDALFYGAPASESAFLVSARQSGHLVRGWDFDSASLATDPPANYAATNHPWDDWYQDLTRTAAR
ncbi:hypothetical protein GCM10022222_56910 [Amycolatopsis ultiminotia]|uniref:Phosphoinositide phospholipase C, Ca2+-dependent n=1 Tax=Amycolatopsis ultiminotia TaxID=543629 RepID=A0ABP6XJL2_9PSEU